MYQLTPVPESIQEALSTAIAKARLMDKRNIAMVYKQFYLHYICNKFLHKYVS